VGQIEKLQQWERANELERRKAAGEMPEAF
jgi:hypothetical protein